MYAEQFFKFVKEKDPDEIIDHSSWRACAVGEFWSQVIGSDQIYHDANNCALLAELEADHDFICEVLNHGGLDESEMEDYAAEHSDILHCESYGDLQRIIDAHEGHSWAEGIAYYNGDDELPPPA